MDELQDVYKDSALPYYMKWEDEEYTTLHGNMVFF